MPPPEEKNMEKKQKSQDPITKTIPLATKEIEEAIKTLQKLLAVDPAEITLESAKNRFEEIAGLLLHRFVLVSNQSTFRVTEIEFYFNDLLKSSSSANHPDTFAHGDTLQLKLCGAWYFHRSGPTLKGGTYKGLDLCFGEPNKAYGGILLRSMVKVEEGEEKDVIEGPCNLVNTILDLNSRHENLKLFVENDLKGVKSAFDLQSKLFLQPCAPFDAKIYSSPRVGLTLKRKDEGLQYKPYFLMQAYRFISSPKQIKKGKINLLLALASRGMTVEAITDLCQGQKNSVVQNVMTWQKAVQTLQKKGRSAPEKSDAKYEGLELLQKAHHINEWFGQPLASVSDFTSAYAAWHCDFGQLATSSHCSNLQ